MAIAVVFEFPNDSVDKYDQALAEQPELREQPGRTHHICFEVGAGWNVIDVWESEDAFAKFGEVLGPTMQRLGLEAEPKIYPVHNTM